MTLTDHQHTVLYMVSRSPTGACDLRTLRDRCSHSMTAREVRRTTHWLVQSGMLWRTGLYSGCIIHLTPVGHTALDDHNDLDV